MKVEKVSIKNLLTAKRSVATLSTIQMVNGRDVFVTEIRECVFVTLPWKVKFDKLQFGRADEPGEDRQKLNTRVYFGIVDKSKSDVDRNSTSSQQKSQQHETST